MENVEYNLINVIKDFVLLFFLIGNDFLPRCYGFNIREKGVEYLITGFKRFLHTTNSYVVCDKTLNRRALAALIR